MYMREVLPEVKKVLTNELKLPKCDVKEEVDCVSLDFLLGDVALRIVIRERRLNHGYIAKVLPISDYAYLLQSCRESEYIPYGLYIISESLEDLIRKLKDKTPKILNYLRR